MSAAGIQQLHGSNTDTMPTRGLWYGRGWWQDMGMFFWDGQFGVGQGLDMGCCGIADFVFRFLAKSASARHWLRVFLCLVSFRTSMNYFTVLFQCTFRCICFFDSLIFHVAFYSLHPSMFSFEPWQPIRNLLPSIVSIVWVGNSLNGVFCRGVEIPSFQTFPSWIFEAHKKTNDPK